VSDARDGTAERARSPSRGEVWQRLGAPTEQVGSVNDPRTHEEQGRVWNEKWVYLHPDSGRPTRVVLWNRYDLLGCFGVAEDGTLRPEPLDGA